MYKRGDLIMQPLRDFGRELDFRIDRGFIGIATGQYNRFVYERLSEPFNHARNGPAGDRRGCPVVIQRPDP